MNERANFISKAIKTNTCVGYDDDLLCFAYIVLSQTFIVIFYPGIKYSVPTTFLIKECSIVRM